MYAWVRQLYERYLAFSQRSPWLVLGVLFGVSALFLWVGTGLKVRGDLEDLFPEDTPAVVRAKETRRLLGNTQELRILIGSKDRDLNRTIAQKIGTFAGSREDVSRVEFRRDVSFFEKNGLLFVSIPDLEDLQTQVSEAIADAVKDDLGLDEGFEAEEAEGAEEDKKPKAGTADPDAGKTKLPTLEDVKKKHKVEGFNEFFESPDGEVIGVKIYPKFRATDTTKTELLNKALDAELTTVFAAHPDAGLSYVMDGDYSQVTRATQQIMSDMAVSGIWALLGIALVVILFFRRIRALIMVLIVLGLSTVWMMAFAQVAVGYLNLVTSIIFAILFGMGVDFVIHGMSRVDEDHIEGVPLDTAVRTGMLGLARPVFNAMLTTAVTFWALIVFDFRGFSQLGLIAGFGVAFALLIFYLAYPPAATAFNRIWKEKARKRKDSHPPADQHEAAAAHVGGLSTSPPVTRGVKRVAWAMVAFIIALAGVSAYLASDLGFDSDMGKFRVKDNQAENTLKKKYREAETRSASPVLVVTKDLAETERAQRYLAANMERFPIVTEVSSVFSFVPTEQEQKISIIKEIKRKIDNKYGALEGQAKTDADELRRYLTPEVFGAESLPEWVRARFTDTEGRFGRYLLLFTSGHKSNALVSLETQKQVGEIEIPAEGALPAIKLTSSASFYISGEAYSIVKREGPWAALIGLLVVVFVVLFDFRRPRELFMILTPILSGFAITLGLMTLIDMPLDLFNVVVLPQIFGIGIDTGTHLTHRIKEGGPRVVHNVRATAIAAGVSSLLTVVGFASLLPVTNAGLQSIGLLAVLGIGISYVVNVVMFTAFQWILRPTRPA